MNFSIALLLVIGVAFVVAQSPSSQDDCKENSTFDACPPRNCPPGQFCTQQCIPACVCNDGYALNKQGVCEKVFTSPGNDDDGELSSVSELLVTDLTVWFVVLLQSVVPNRCIWHVQPTVHSNAAKNRCHKENVICVAKDRAASVGRACGKRAMIVCQRRNVSEVINYLFRSFLNFKMYFCFQAE